MPCYSVLMEHNHLVSHDPPWSIHANPNHNLEVLHTDTSEEYFLVFCQKLTSSKHDKPTIIQTLHNETLQNTVWVLLRQFNLSRTYQTQPGWTNVGPNTVTEQSTVGEQKNILYLTSKSKFWVIIFSTVVYVLCPHSIRSADPLQGIRRHLYSKQGQIYRQTHYICFVAIIHHGRVLESM